MDRNYKTIAFGIFKVGLILGLIFWGLNWISIQSISAPSQKIVATKRGWNAKDLEELVQKEFANNHLEIPPNGESRQPIPASNILESLLEDFKAAKVEIYALEDQNELQWRIYNKSTLQFQIFFSKTTQKSSLTISKLPTGPKPLLSIILTGWDFRNAENIVQFKEPLNFLLSPKSPFSLSNAQMAAHHWHEIIMDGQNATEWYFNSIPYTYVVLTKDRPKTPVNWSILHPSTVQEVDIDSTIPLHTESSIWLVNVKDFSSEEIHKWLKVIQGQYALLLLSENPIFADNTL